MSESLTLDLLRKLVDGEAVAIRGRAELEAAGGPGEKVFPPSHAVDGNERRPGAKYAFETRRINGNHVPCVLLDSVQSQANRMEEALQALWDAKQIKLPVIEVDLQSVAPDVRRVTSLTAPHRIADALLRDSFVGGTLFRLSPLGKSFVDATASNAGPLFKVCPTGLVFGLWDSTGPKGGLGAKFARALTSEIVGVGAEVGVKTSSRIDPTGIVTRAAEIYEALDTDERWTHDPEAAVKGDKGPKKFKEGKVSDINHSNVPPTIDSAAGGVTIDYAIHTVVLSLAALRRLSFVEGGSLEARTVLAALGLLAVTESVRRGHDLRSRCLLVPRAARALSLESVAVDGTVRELSLSSDDAIKLYGAAVEALPAALRFQEPAGEPLAKLAPSEKLAHLIKRSRELAATQTDGGDA